MSSTLSPARRLRNKTSDLTDFFRNSTTANQARQSQRDITASTSSATLEVPSGDESHSKKKITRIPLFGRSRKKSNHSAASSPFASSEITRESSDIGEQPSRAVSTDRRPHTASGSSAYLEPPALPSKHLGTSLGSKIVAHFGHSKKSTRPTHGPALTPDLPPQSPANLSPILPNNRSPSIDSSSSSGSRTRSTTPRPTIKVSTTTPIEEFSDLFTTLATASKSSRVSSQSTLQALKKDDTDGPSLSKTPSQRNRSPDLTPAYRRGQTPASAIAAAHRQNASEKPSSTSSKSNSRKNSDSDSTPRDSDTRESLGRTPTPPEKDKELRLPSRRPSLPTTSTYGSDTPPLSSSRSSRMKAPGSSRGRPPSMPLPLPPTPTSLPPEPPFPLPLRPTPEIRPLPQLVSQLPPSVPTSPVSPTRPRAHTIGAVTPTSLPRTPSMSKSTSQDSSTPRSQPIPVDIESLDIDTATPEQLREALRMRNAQVDNLSRYVVKLKDNHAAEVHALEKKIATLERDNEKQEKVMQGLKWIVSREGPPEPKAMPSNILNPSRLSPPSSYVDSDPDGKRPPPGAGRRAYYNSDSGAESHSESLAASGSESSVRHKRFRKLYTLGEATSNTISRATSRRSSNVPRAEGRQDAVQKRASLGSSVPSPSSSTSSLLPPSPSVTMSSLSAIPEGPPSSLKPTRYESGSEQLDDRRALRAAHRISTSSVASSSTAASSAYSTNIKRSRPPSIAQVLEKSPNIDDVLEKLRPFA